MGSDPQSYLSYQHQREQEASRRELRKELPYATYLRDSPDAPGRLLSLSRTRKMAEQTVASFPLSFGYVEAPCKLCGNPKDMHRPEIQAHHSECTLDQFEELK